MPLHSFADRPVQRYDHTVQTPGRRVYTRFSCASQTRARKPRLLQRADARGLDCAERTGIGPPGAGDLPRARMGSSKPGAIPGSGIALESRRSRARETVVAFGAHVVTHLPAAGVSLLALAFDGFEHSR